MGSAVDSPPSHSTRDVGGHAMEFLLLFNEGRGAPPPEKEGLAAMKKYVGAANNRPDSRTPRRLPKAIPTTERTPRVTR